MANPRNQDLFQYVPEPLLSLILSSLPFKEASKTSVLSKQWRNLWYTTKNIEFHERFFVKPDHDHSDDEKRERRLAFLHFIQQWMQMHGERSANKFCFSLFDAHRHREVVDKAITFAFSRKVKILEIDFSDPSWFEDDFFRNGSHQLWLSSIWHDIERLKLTSIDLMINSPTKIYSSLKCLSLACVNLPSGRLNKILSVCPSLEDLSLNKCKDVGFLMISNAPSLKRFYIATCDLDYLAGIMLDAPSLQFFHYRGLVPPFVGKNLTTLNVVVLDFSIQTAVVPLLAELLYKFLRELCSAKDLSICSYMLQGIQLANDPFLLEPRLENVQTLRLTDTELIQIQYYGITFFLDSCPNLEELFIDIKLRDKVLDNDPPRRMEDHPFMTKEGFIIASECLRKTLKMVRITGYTGLTFEARVLKYLLKYGFVLRTVEIHLVPNIHLYYRQRAQALQEFPSASQNIHFSVL